MSEGPKFVTISRDAFARHDVVRTKCGPGESCHWCGQPARFEYGIWWDDRRAPDWALGAYCSIGCYRSYYA